VRAGEPDCIPHSRNELIKVRLLKTNPQITLGEIGRLDWALYLPANSITEIYYQFAIEHPDNIQPIGLEI
jgi:hypothetical protein